MTPEKPVKKKSRFIAEEEDIEILGDRMPDPDQIKEADRVFGKLLKDKKKKK